MAAEEEEEKPVPDSGALFTFGKSKFADNCPSKFWLKNDKPAHISCGDEHTALVTENGKLYVFGSNAWGQLGIGSGNVINKPTCVKGLKSEKVKFAACGRNHTLVCTEQGKVYSSGWNSEGQLGLGDTTERTSFHEITFFNTQDKIKQLSAGSNTSAALTVDGKLFMWGENMEGQLGLANEKNICTPHQVDIGKPVSWISCGYYHSAFVTQDGDVYTFGEPENGKLGLPTEKLEKHKQPQHVLGISGKVKMVSCGGGHTIAVTDKEVYTFGEGQFGQLGHGTFIFETTTPKVVDALKPHKIRYVACGENHTAVITDKGLLYTFGDGRYGKLGLGDENFTNQFSPTLCMNFLKFNVQSVASGGCHMIVFATPRTKESESVMFKDLKENYLTVNGNGDASATLERSLSARIRRREKKHTPEEIQHLSRTLPPLNGHLLESTLPVSSKTVHSGLFKVRQASSESSAHDSAAVSKLEGESQKENQVKSFSADDSDTVSQRSFGGTTDTLNMTHVVSLNRGSSTFSPVHKRKINKDEDSEEEEEEDEEEMDEDANEDDADDPTAEKNEQKTQESKPDPPVTAAEQASEINQQQSVTDNQKDNEVEHPKSVNGANSPENTGKATLLDKTRRISFFKRRSTTSQKSLQGNQDVNASKENDKEKAKDSKEGIQNRGQEKPSTTEQSNHKLTEAGLEQQDKKSKSTTCILL